MRTALRFYPVAMLLIIACLALNVQAAGAQEQDWDISAYEVTVVVQEDGAIDVVESITFDLREGSFSRGERSIDTRYIQEITGIDVTSPDAAIRSLEVDHRRRSTEIRWTYDEREAPVQFDVSYTAHDVVYTEDERNVIDLQLIGDEWSVPIHNVRASILLPFPSLTEEDIDARPGRDATVTSTGGAWDLTYTYPQLAANEGYRATIRIPPFIETREGQALPGTTSGRQVFIGGVLGFLGFLMVIGGTMWYARDPKPTATSPPPATPDLPLHLAGYLALWDNLMEWRRIITALIYDLAQRGLLSLTWVKPEASSWLESSQEELQITVSAETHTLPDIERALLNKLRAHDTLRSFMTNENGFLREQAQAIEDELARNGLIETSQGRGIGITAAGIGLIALGVGAIVLSSGLPAAIGGGIGLGCGLGALVILLDQRLYSTSLTVQGATVREQILSFQEHLRKQIEDLLDDDPVGSATIFIEHMPYLVLDLQMKPRVLQQLGEALEDHPEALGLPAWIQDRVTDVQQRQFTTTFVVFYMMYMNGLSGTGASGTGGSGGGSVGAGAVGGAGGGGGGVS